MNERPRFLADLAQEDRHMETPRRVEAALRQRIAASRKPGLWGWLLPMSTSAAAALLVALWWFPQKPQLQPQPADENIQSKIEQAPVEQAPVEQAPVEQAPVEQAPVEQAPVEQAPVEQAPPVLEAQSVAPGEQLRLASAAPARRPASRSSARALPKVATPVQERITRRFYELAYAPPELLANSRMMRVRVPRAALLSFGLPLNAYRAQDEKVAADVIYTEDGIARAIRFIETNNQE
jgi:hypothetical protein